MKKGEIRTKFFSNKLEFHKMFETNSFKKGPMATLVTIGERAMGHTWVRQFHLLVKQKYSKILIFSDKIEYVGILLSVSVQIKMKL